jgi:hypothetical protein
VSDTRALSPELTEGLTDWAVVDRETVGAQIRSWGANNDTVLVVAIPEPLRTTETSEPFMLDAGAARMLRDLLNIATARGYL